MPCVYLVSKKAISYCIRFPDRLHHIAHTVTSHFLGKSRKKLNCTKKCIFSRRSHFFNCHRTSETKKWNKSKKRKKDIIGDLYQEERCFFPVNHIIRSFLKWAALVNSSQNWPWFDLVLESSPWLALKQQNDHLIASVLSEFKFGRYFYWTEVSKIRPWIFLWFFYLPCPTGALFIDIFEL